MHNKKQYLLFLLSGGISAFANFLSRIFFSQFTSYAVAVAMAYAVGIVSAYALMRSIVFRKDGISARDSFLKFVLVNLYGFTQTLLVSVRLLPLVEYNRFAAYAPIIAHGCALALLSITSFFMHKLFTFK
jgi:putative flippase GtrA